MNSSQTIASIRAWAVEHRLSENHLDRWLKMNECDRAASLSAVQALRLSTGAAVSAMTTLDELSLRESCSVESILLRDPVARIVRGSGPPSARARAFLSALKAIRYPRLAEATRRLWAEVAAIGLESGISVLLPKDLGSDELRIEIRAKSGGELARLIGALSANSGKLARIADLLSGGSET